MLAGGPEPAFVLALTLKVYKGKVEGFRLGISIEVSSAETSCVVESLSGPTTCTVYPVRTPFSFFSGTGIHKSSAVVGSLRLTVNPPGRPEGAGRDICTHAGMY